MTEAEFLKDTIDQAELNDISWFHIDDSRRNPSTKGIPDLFLCGSHHCMWRELKMPGNKPESDQVVWIYRMRAAGEDVEVWYPNDKEKIRKELERLNTP